MNQEFMLLSSALGVDPGDDVLSEVEAGAVFTDGFAVAGRA